MSPLLIRYPPNPLNQQTQSPKAFAAQNRQSYRDSKSQLVQLPPTSVTDNGGLKRLGDLPKDPHALQQQSLTQNTGRQTPTVTQATERTCP